MSFSLDNMGSTRTCPHVLAWPSLLRPFCLLRHWCRRPCGHLLPGQAQAQVSSAVPHGTSHLRRCRGYATCDTPQLSFMGSSRLPLSVLDQEAPLQMVVKTQLPYIICTRSRARPCNPVHLLCVHAAWYRSTKLVGKRHRLVDDGCPRYRDTSTCGRGSAVRA